MVVIQIGDLGIIFTNNLSFNNNIKKMCNKALRVFNFIRCYYLKILYFTPDPYWTGIAFSLNPHQTRLIN